MKTITIDIIKGIADVHAVEGDVGVKVIITNTPQEWKNCTVFALITQDSANHHTKVINNEFDVPSAFTDANKAFKIGVYAVGANGTRDVRPSIWIRVENSDFTKNDIEITQQNIEDILKLQTLYTEYENAEEDRAKAEEVRQANESERKEAERNRKTELIDIKRRLSNAETDIDDLENGKVDKIDGKGLSTNDYSDSDYNKLAMIEYGAQVNKPVDQTYKSDSENAQSGKAVAEAISKLVNGSPEALDTLFELANALGNNPNFATAVMDEIGKKVDKVEGYGLAQIRTIGNFISIAMHNKDVGNIINHLLYGANKIDEMLEEKADKANSKGGFEAGANARCITEDGTIIDAVQLGKGENHNTRTFQVYDYQMMDADGNIPEDRMKKGLYPLPETELPPASSFGWQIPELNKSYSIGDIGSLSLGFPDVANDGDVVYVSFYSTDDDNPNILLNTSNILICGDIPEFETQHLYEIYAKYNASLSVWLVGISEYGG